MKPQRIRIGVVLSDVQLGYQTDLLQGISAQARALGWDVFVISNINNILCDRTLRRSEDLIYTLPARCRLDGILYNPNNFFNKDVQAALNAQLRALAVPVLCIDDAQAGFPALGEAENTAWFGTLVTHFIQAHHCKKIYCLTGPEGSVSAQERLAGYRQAMRAHGLPVLPQYEFYGDFWVNSARKLVARICAGTLELPDAIVCANDDMALSLTEALLANGIAVPGRVLVGGFDGSPYGQQCVPSLTSARNPTYNLGVRSVCRLHEMMTGQAVTPTRLRPFMLLPGSTCGCGTAHCSIALDLRNKRRETLYHADNMTLHLAGAASLRETLGWVHYYRFLLDDHVSYAICLCSDWDSDDPEPRDACYTSTMLWHNSETPLTFPLTELLPPPLQKHTPAAYFCLPLSYAELLFGYLVLYADDPSFVPTDAHCFWSSRVCSALEEIRTKNCIAGLRGRVILTEQRDTLTGLLNAQGLERQAATLFARAREDCDTALLLCADIDGLRHINDSHGTAEGDNAIQAAARAVSAACSNNEICARMQDGSFAVCGCGDYSQEQLERMVYAVRQSYTAFNTTARKPYQLSLSIGLTAQPFAHGTTVYSLMDQAKQDLQLDKQRHRIQLKAPYFNTLSEQRLRIYATPRLRWDIADFAKEAQVSVSHFRRLYRAQFQCSFTADLIQSRLTLARQLLTDTSMSIAKVAAECGYQSEDFFIRQFKKYTGVTPTEYRCAARAVP